MWKCPFLGLSVVSLSVPPFDFPLASSYLWFKLSLPGLSYCLSLIWDQIRARCQPGLASAMLKILFTALQQSTRPFQSPTTTEAGLQQRFCWYQESCRHRVTAKAEAPCLSDTGGKRGSVCFSLLLCYWKISPMSSAYSCIGDVLTMENQEIELW